jgi:hypothetical protein
MLQEECLRAGGLDAHALILGSLAVAVVQNIRKSSSSGVAPGLACLPLAASPDSTFMRGSAFVLPHQRNDWTDTIPSLHMS